MKEKKCVFKVLLLFFMFFSASWSLYFPYLLNYQKSHKLFFTFCPHFSAYCIRTLFYMHYLLWIMQCFLGFSGCLWRRQAEIRVVLSAHTQSNNRSHSSILRYVWWISDVIVTADKSAWGNTGIYIMCFEVKRDVTPTYLDKYE